VPRRVVIPGGSGFLGRAVAADRITRGDEVVVLTRGPAGARDGVRHVHWDAATLGGWTRELEGADAVVHLCGRRVDVRSSPSNLRELVRSRVDTVRLVGRALGMVAAPPPTWVQAGTVAVHGDAGDRVIDDSTPVPTVGPPQMTGVARAWEQAFRQATATVPRRVLLRMAVAIGGDDPATAQLAQLTRLGLGGPVGGGRQWVSWIALPDLVRVLSRAIDDATVTGTYVVASPRPVTNRELMATLRGLHGRRVGLPAPASATRLGAWLLGSDGSLALTGRRAVPTRLLAEGFRFEVPEVEDALRGALAHLAGRGSPPVPGSGSGSES
jgi:uncharacterized protein